MNPAQDTSATPTPETDRDDKGRFRKGNPGGPGNPFARQGARLRQVLLDAVSAEDMLAAVDALKKKAAEGDVPAIKLLLSYTLGKPIDSPHPDTLDQHELQTFLFNHCATPHCILPLLTGTPLEFLLTVLRNGLPALLDSKMRTAKEFLRQPPEPEDTEDDDEMSDEEAEEIARQINADREKVTPEDLRCQARASGPANDAASKLDAMQKQLQQLLATVGKDAATAPAMSELLLTLSQRMGRANHSPTDDNGNIGARKNGKPPSGNGSNGRL